MADLRNITKRRHQAISEIRKRVSKYKIIKKHEGAEIIKDACKKYGLNEENIIVILHGLTKFTNYDYKSDFS